MTSKDAVLRYSPPRFTNEGLPTKTETVNVRVLSLVSTMQEKLKVAPRSKGSSETSRSSASLFSSRLRGYSSSACCTKAH